MISVSDILKILDQIPIWKTLRELPKRLEALESRVAQLEAKPMSVTPKGRECPSCGVPMKLTMESSDPELGAAGVKVHALYCEPCEFQTERKYRPGVGYM